MQLTRTVPKCQVYLNDEPHYLIPDAAEILGVDPRQVYRWLEDENVPLTRRRYPDDDSKGVCIPAGEVEALGAQRDQERREAFGAAAAY